MAKKAGRVQRAHKDGKLKSIKREIEKLYGFPKGSVRLVKPNKRAMRDDATVATLRAAWQKA